METKDSSENQGFLWKSWISVKVLDFMRIQGSDGNPGFYDNQGFGWKSRFSMKTKGFGENQGFL